jgi:hypothetical protein
MEASMDEEILVVRVDVWNNSAKYANGMSVQVVDESGNPVKRQRKRSAREMSEDEARRGCLNCKKGYCDGSVECFSRERDRRR